LNTLSYKTVSANGATVEKKWYVIDAESEIVGRLASEAAKILRGKHKTSFTPHVDCGDNVIIINADKIRFTGKKMAEKEYQFYSGHPGGRRVVKARDLIQKRPTYLVEKAIKGMLPKNRLGAEIYRNLFVYEGGEHPHQAQQPTPLVFNTK
jgi:large subunit ribosomal protein L13